MSWAALYTGDCVRCEEPIRVGQQIDRDSGGLLHHVDCPEPPATYLDMQPGETVCPRCFTIHAGECV
jgi:hypothetical protein